MDNIPQDGRPVLVLAEGLSMYLPEDQMKSLVLTLKKTFPGCHFIFDAYSRLTARTANRHPSVRRTGATLHWGIDDAREIESWAPGIQLVEEWCFDQSEVIAGLTSRDRLIFKLTSLFPIVRKAHRLIYIRCV